MTKSTLLTMLLLAFSLCSVATAYYTTDGQNIVERSTGEIVQLRGIGLGGWLLPEGYMWGIRKLDRPRQFEAAIEALIGPKDAEKFWDIYYTNFVTREDVRVMKSWGVNTIRVPLLASMLQPRQQQPDERPFVYDEKKFEYLDNFVGWCEELGMGVIWDLHGAPGGQNAENISDSDGTARLWTEKDRYWKLTIDLWDKITKRYAGSSCIVGYDLLNEPLLGRYAGIDPALLRELYVILTQTIRETDSEGIIFIEGDDWAQDFTVLEPMDWDPHLVLAFHSYPPTHSSRGLKRWDAFRKKYDMPLWHGETGEQDPPWELYERSTKFLEDNNVGWNWWTHKKFNLSRQPWVITRTEGFEKILDYWNGNGPKPSRRKAKRWLFKQAALTNSKHCIFLPEMVTSLYPLDPSEYAASIKPSKPEMIKGPENTTFMNGFPCVLRTYVSGYQVVYQWYRNGVEIPGASGNELRVHDLAMDERQGSFMVKAWNDAGIVKSDAVKVEMETFVGQEIQFTDIIPLIDGKMDPAWVNVDSVPLKNPISGTIASDEDLSAWFRVLWDEESLYFLIEVLDDILSSTSTVDFLQDGIEIYFDGNNSKSKFYGEDEFQLRSVIDGDTMYVDIGAEFKGIHIGKQITSEGYMLEAAIPWQNLNTRVMEGQFVGLDIHINDSDSETRNGKIAWYCTKDNAYQSPAHFGTLKLVR